MKLTLLFEESPTSSSPESSNVGADVGADVGAWGGQTQRFGKWEVRHDAETKEIFPKLPDGETIRVVHAKAVIYLTYLPTGEEVTFWITKAGNHHDSRDPKKTFPKNHVIRELDRVLGSVGGGDVGSAIYAAAIRDMKDALPTPKMRSTKTVTKRNPDYVPKEKEAEEVKEYLPVGVLKKEVHPYSQGGQVTAVDVVVGKVADEVAALVGKRPQATAEFPDVKERLGIETEWFMIFAD